MSCVDISRFSWMILYFVIATICMFVISAIMWGSRIIRHANYGVLLLFFLLCAYALLSFLMMWSTLFRSTNIANIVVGLILPLLGILYYAILVSSADSISLHLQYHITKLTSSNSSLRGSDKAMIWIKRSIQLPIFNNSELFGVCK